MLLLVLPISGIEPFREFIAVVVPTQGRATYHWTNQPIWGVLSNLPPWFATQQALKTAAVGFQFVSFFSLAIWLIIPRNVVAVDSAAVAGVVLLLCWLHLFGPITWAHYAVYFVPFTGWMSFHARNSATRALAMTSLLLVFIPWSAVPLPHLFHDVLTRWSLFSGMLLFAAFAAHVFIRTPEPATP